MSSESVMNLLRRIVKPSVRNGVSYPGNLIRDRVPEMLSRHGIRFAVVKLGMDDQGDEERFDSGLREKIVEEAVKLLAARGRREKISALVRLISVTNAYLYRLDVDGGEMESRLRKLDRSWGGFSQRFVLVSREIK